MKTEDFQDENLLPTEAILIDRFESCQRSIENSYSDERKKNGTKRLRLHFGYEQFICLVSKCAEMILERRGEKTGFVIDTDNEIIIKQIYLYLRQDSRFSGDLRKGILLMGKYGCGKTLILQAVSTMYNTIISELNNPRPVLKFIKSTELLDLVQEKSVKLFSQMPLIIDELGREPKQIMNYGNLRSPLVELLCERYDVGAWTHGTTNFTLETLSSDSFYGKMTGDRIKSMFNFLELKGGSRRK